MKKKKKKILFFYLQVSFKRIERTLNLFKNKFKLNLFTNSSNLEKINFVFKKKKICKNKIFSFKKMISKNLEKNFLKDIFF